MQITNPYITLYYPSNQGDDIDPCVGEHASDEAAAMAAKETLEADWDGRVVLARVEAVFTSKRVVDRAGVGSVNGGHG